MFEQDEMQNIIEKYRVALDAGEKITVKLKDGYFYILKQDTYKILIELFDETIEKTIDELFPSVRKCQEVEN